MTGNLSAYYAARASEYERVYAKPERQADLAQLRNVVAEYFAGCRVLEVACGTGYWTSYLASSARTVNATDIGDEVLEVARSKPWPTDGSVEFIRANAFDLSTLPHDFDAAFVGFWWSHVPNDDLGSFLEGLHAHLQPQARVMVLDNRYVDGSSTPISRSDLRGNTYQRRVLSTGEAHEVLKNFPTAAEVRKQLGAHRAVSIEVVELPYYWCATYRLATA